jgi:hypothetical protein
MCISYTLQILVHFWASGDQSLSLSSFLMIREVASLLPDCLDLCLTKGYNTYLSSSKHVDNRNIKHMDFLMNCLVELYSLDVQKSGERAATSVGQLSAILRQASKTKEKVHNNAYICSCACNLFTLNRDILVFLPYHANRCFGPACFLRDVLRCVWTYQLQQNAFK